MGGDTPVDVAAGARIHQAPTDHRSEYWASYDQSDTAFVWTQWNRSEDIDRYGAHGPGPELLDGYHRVADLGCAAGMDTAILAGRGHQAVGVDVSAAQINRAREHHAHLVDQGLVVFVHSPAEQYLADTAARGERFDAVFSNWGALMHTDPDVLLPAVRSALRPGGALLFSHVQPLRGCTGRQGHFAEGFRGRHLGIYRWLHTPAGWRKILTRHGFTRIQPRLIRAPEVGRVGTVLVQARTPEEP